MVNIIVKTDSILNTLNRDGVYFKEHGIKTELVNSHILYVGKNDDVCIVYASSENNILGRRADYWIGFDYDEVRYRLRTKDAWLKPDTKCDERHIASVIIAFNPIDMSKHSIINYSLYRAKYERNMENVQYVAMTDNTISQEITKTMLNSFYGMYTDTDMVRRKMTSAFDDSIYNYQRQLLNKERENMRAIIKPTIKDVKFNGPATIVFWSDDTKTVVKCEGEKFDKEKGLAMAIAKKFVGTNETKSNYYDIFDKYCSDPEEPSVSIADAVSNLANLFGKILSSEKKCSNCKHLYRHDPGMPCESCIMHSRWEEN